MIDVITVSTHDAKKLVADLVRLLEAEEHRVRVISGRHADREIEAARDSRDAILMVWSEDAPSSSYMREWLRQSDPYRLVEIATAPGWPERKDRKGAVIDFSNWRGERGGRAWNALNDRLRAVANYIDPPKPPAKHAAMAMGLASLAAVTVAIGVRSNQDVAPAPATQEPQQTVQLEAPTDSVGGAIYSVEPASIEDLSAVPNVRPLRATPLEFQSVEFIELQNEPLPEVRDPTLMERIRALNPLGGSEPYER
jgi:hypothetical protein